MYINCILICWIYIYICCRGEHLKLYLKLWVFIFFFSILIVTNTLKMMLYQKNFTWMKQGNHHQNQHLLSGRVERYTLLMLALKSVYCLLPMIVEEIPKFCVCWMKFCFRPNKKIVLFPLSGWKKIGSIGQLLFFFFFLLFFHLHLFNCAY